MKGKFIAYLRVSTSRQGQSGLGLEAQRKAVSDYLGANGWELLQEFLEVETGKGSNALQKRPILREAIAFAKKHKATLLVAKLDRLARNVAFISALMESKVDFIACDFPEANRLTIHLMSAMAEYERELISKRTKEALAAARRRGVILGNPKLPEYRAKAIERSQKHATQFAESLRNTITGFKASGLTQRAMADEMNSLGVKTSRGAQWTQSQIQRVIKRLGI